MMKGKWVVREWDDGSRHGEPAGSGGPRYMTHGQAEELYQILGKFLARRPSSHMWGDWVGPELPQYWKRRTFEEFCVYYDIRIIEPSELMLTLEQLMQGFRMWWPR